MDYLVVREFNGLYIILDIIFLVLLGFLLLYHKKRMAFLFGIAGALIYFLVDYGIFHLLLQTREVEGVNTFWFLLWLSTSYGFTNFAWIWLLLSKDKRSVEWSLLIVIGWLSVALIGQSMGSEFIQIHIERGVASYHGTMAIILLVGYAIVLIKNLKSDDKNRIPVLWLLFIGILVQFSWEAVLLLSGIRPAEWRPLAVNSLLETNLGMPYFFFIHLALSKKYKEDATLINNRKDASLAED